MISVKRCFQMPSLNLSWCSFGPFPHALSLDPREKKTVPSFPHSYHQEAAESNEVTPQSLFSHIRQAQSPQPLLREYTFLHKRPIYYSVQRQWEQIFFFFSVSLCFEVNLLDLYSWLSSLTFSNFMTFVSRYSPLLEQSYFGFGGSSGIKFFTKYNGVFDFFQNSVSLSHLKLNRMEEKIQVGRDLSWTRKLLTH